MLRTEKEVRAMKEKLWNQRESVPEFSFFGDPNWRIMDAQIEALEWVLGDRENDELVDED